MIRKRPGAMQNTLSKNMSNTVTEANYRPWLIWGLAALFYFYEYFLQVSPNVMANDLMRAFHITGAQLGNLVAIYFYADASMQIPVGLLIDRFGPRKLLIFAVFLCVIGNLIFASANVLFQAEIGRLFIGLGSSFAVIGCFKLAANWFPVKRFTLLVGLTLTIGMSGAVFGQAPLALLVDDIGWRGSMYLLAVVGAALAIAMWIFVRDNPSTAKTSVHNATDLSAELHYLWDALKGILRRSQNWWTAIYGGLMFAPTSAFGALWGVSFLMSRYGLSRPSAADMISLLFIGWAIGSPTFGAYSDYVGKRKPPMMIGAIGALIAMIFILYIYLPAWSIYLTLFLFGFFSSGFLASFSIIRENNPGNANATAFGFMNTLNMVGGAVLQPLIGHLLDISWQHKTINGARLFSTHNYQMALTTLPACIAIAIVFWFFIKETFCRLKQKHL